MQKQEAIFSGSYTFVVTDSSKRQKVPIKRNSAGTPDFFTISKSNSFFSAHHATCSYFPALLFNLMEHLKDSK